MWGEDPPTLGQMIQTGAHHHGTVVSLDLNGHHHTVMDPSPVDPDPPASPQHPHQPVESLSVFLAGFKDCTEEAITYLLNVEHMSEHDPVIRGLRLHLWRRQLQLDLAKAFEYMQNNGGEGHPMPDIGELGGEALDSLLGTDPHMDHDDTEHLMLRGLNQQGVTSDDSGLENDSSVISDDMDSSLNDSITTSSASTMPTISESVATLASSCVVSTSSVGSNIPLPSHSPSLAPSTLSQATESPSGHHENHDGSQPQPAGQDNQDLTPHEVLSLAFLAQSNPAIASVTRQLIDLLEDEDEESEEDSGSDEVTSEFDDSIEDAPLL